MAIIGFIYIIENTQNSKVYIGQTLYTDLNQRFHEHKISANQPRLQNRSLYKAFIELGIEAFSIRLLESCAIELLDERECYWISYYDSYNNGYNDTMGGVSRQRYSYEAILSDFMDGLSTKEICAKYGCSDTVITSALNAYSCEHHLNGAQVNARIIVAKDKQTNEVIKRFPFLKAASEWIQSKNNIKTTSLHSIKISINRAANPQCNRHSAYGYKWEYEKPICNVNNQGTGIYGIKDMNERILYIGHTRRSFASRWAEHLRKYMKLDWPLYHYIRENGINSIVFVVIEEIDSDASIDIFIDREKYWINYYKTNNRDWGLNLRVPVSTVKSHSYAKHIDEIYELLLTGAENNEIMDKFDINASTLSLIRNGKSYYNPDIDYPILPTIKQHRQ